MTKESQIVYEAGSYWVCDDRDAYTVFRNGNVCSTSDSSYAHDDDGLSIAIARCNYLARREATKLPK